MRALGPQPLFLAAGEGLGLALLTYKSCSHLSKASKTIMGLKQKSH